jgi:glycosyltransferase involved in cell wall biosynthesis
MRICLYTTYFPPMMGGAERQASLLAAGLAELGDEVTVVTRHLPGRPAHEVREGVQIYRAIRPGRRGALFGLGLLLTLFAFLARRRDRFDVVHVTGIHLGTYVPCRLRRRGDFRVVLRPMGPGPLGDLATLAAQRFWPLWRGGDGPTLRHLLDTIRKADAVVALNQDLAIELADAGFPSERIVCINNGVPVPDLAWNEANAQAVRRRLGLPGGPVLLCVGRLHKQKGVDDLLRSLPFLLETYPTLTLLLLGKGPFEDDLKGLAGELGIASQVRFLGFQDPGPYLQAADIFVLPSWGEGISSALLEAMAAGLPCVATRVSGNSEVIRHNETGLLVEPGQPPGLAEAVARLVEDTTLCGLIGANARQRVQAAYSLKQMVTNYQHLFTHLLVHGTIPAAVPAQFDRGRAA